MRVIVDTSVWSEAFRRPKGARSDIAMELNSLIEAHRVVMLGPIRQELLSGLRSREAFEHLRKSLRAFPDLVLSTIHYETAAEYYNKCREKGVTASFIDLLIAATAVTEDYGIFTKDKDFYHLAKLLPLRLHEIPVR